MAIASGASVARLGTGTTGTGGGGDDDDDRDGDDDDDARDGREMRDGKRRVKGRTSSEAVTEFVTYACATSEGGCATCGAAEPCGGEGGASGESKKAELSGETEGGSTKLEEASGVGERAALLGILLGVIGLLVSFAIRRWGAANA